MSSLRAQAQGTVDPSVGYIIHVKQVDLLGKVRHCSQRRDAPTGAHTRRKLTPFVLAPSCACSAVSCGPS